MCWINLAANRWEIANTAKESIENREHSSEALPWAIRPALFALMWGETSWIDRAFALSHDIQSRFYSKVADTDLLLPQVLPDVVGLAVIAELSGRDQTSTFTRIAGAPDATDPLMRSLQSVVRRLIDPQTHKRSERHKSGHVANQADWIKRLTRESTLRLLDLALSPDHGLWPLAFQALVLPLGLLYKREARSKGQSVDLLQHFRVGGYPERRQWVLYERSASRPDPISATRKGPEPFGFDALELRNDDLFAYYYLGFRWQAPLLFQKEGSAFHFLEEQDEHFSIVKATLSSELWREVEQRRTGGGVVHVVVHDATKSQAFPADIASAARNYRVRLEVRDVTEA